MKPSGDALVQGGSGLLREWFRRASAALRRMGSKVTTQKSSESSSGIPNLGFGAAASACRRQMSVFLYHHAVAIPPSTADAIAISPNFFQREGGAESCGVFTDLADSKIVAIWKNAPVPSYGPVFEPGLFSL